ncbi:MAG TPA: hypothetical protein VNF68_14200, partial [Candidatus Baltobacteraceae bacterium]|nr:hypothetical protein [Candidatus Baltobacteraceae bacterium]
AFIAALLFAATLPLVAHGDELGSDGKLLNGMAPLNVPFPGTSSPWQSAADTSIHYSELAPLADATHLVELRETASGFAAYLDSRPVGPIIAMPFATAYAQIGPEVYAEGNALAGTVRNVVVASGSTIDRASGSNVCHYINHGAALAFSDGSYVATGTFSRNKPSRFGTRILQ